MKLKTKNQKISSRIFLLLFLAFTTLTYAQKTITGMVVDNADMPLPGASIVEKENPTNGVISDIDGKFSITVASENSSVVVSYIGYTTQEVKVSSDAISTIVLQEGVSLDAVVVTARKKEESLQAVPISITAIGNKDLQRRTIVDIEDITLNTPSFSLDNFGGTKVRPAVRGLGSENTSPGQDFSTGVFYDGVYMSTNGMAAVDVYDIERVETLKGPQGVLWGKNVIGGGINFISSKPKFYNNSQIALTAGNYGLIGLTGFTNVSNSEKVAHRLAFNFRKNNGYAENLNTGRGIDNLQRISARYSSRFAASDEFTIDFSADYTGDKSRGKNIQVFEGNRLDEAQNAQGYTYLLNTYGGNELGTREEFFEENDFAERNTYGARLGLTFDLSENTTLSSISAFREIRDSFFDTYNQFSTAQFEEAAIATNSVVTSLGIGDDTEADQISTELRIESNNEKINWTAGAFLSRENGIQDFVFAVRRATPSDDGLTATSSVTDLTWSPTNTSNDFGLFAQANFDLSSAFELSVGGRYNSNSKDFTNTYGIPAAGVVIWEVDREDSWSAFTWNGSLKYKFNDNAMVYASAATGFKPGGYQVVSTAPVEVSEVPLGEETSTSFELGTKLEFNYKTRLNIALFSTDYEGLQTIFLNQAGGAETSNIESARVSGAEIEFTSAIGKNLFAELRYAYINTDVDGLLAGGETLNDLKLLRVPENEYTANLRYRAQLKNDHAVEISELYSYRGELFDNPQNVPTEVRPAVGLLNSYISYEADSWTLQLWGKNITNENYSVNSFGSQGAYSAVLGAPATVGLTFTKNID